MCHMPSRAAVTRILIPVQEGEICSYSSLSFCLELILSIFKKHQKKYPEISLCLTIAKYNFMCKCVGWSECGERVILSAAKNLCRPRTDSSPSFHSGLKASALRMTRSPHPDLIAVCKKMNRARMVRGNIRYFDLLLYYMQEHRDSSRFFQKIVELLACSIGLTMLNYDWLEDSWMRESIILQALVRMYIPVNRQAEGTINCVPALTSCSVCRIEAR